MKIENTFNKEIGPKMLLRHKGIKEAVLNIECVPANQLQSLLTFEHP